MRNLGLVLAGALFIAASGGAGATALQPGFSPAGEGAITLVQEKKETIKQKIKRIWRNWTGYKFCVRCPIPIPLTTSSCTETGKSREDARAKCVARNQLCYVLDESCR